MLHPEPGRGAVGPRHDADTSRRVPWWEHLLVLALFATLLTGYRLVVAGTDWWLTTVLVIAPVAFAVAATHRWRWYVGALAGSVVGLGLCLWVFVPDSLMFGVLPTLSSLSALADLVQRGGILVMQEAAPAAPAQPIVLVLTGSFAALTLLSMLLLRWRHGVLAIGAVLVHVYAAPALVAGQTPVGWVFVLAAGLWLLLLLVRTHGLAIRGPAAWTPGLAVGLSAVLGGALLAPALPDVSAVARPWGDPPPEVFGRGINPMLQLGQNLRRNSTAVAARYTTTLDDPPYLKVAVLRDFTGRTWRPAAARPTDQFEGAIDLAPGVESTTETTTIAIEDLASTMLPVPYPAQGVSGLEGTWSWQRVGLVLTSEDATTRDQTYTVESLQRQPTAAQMRTFDARVGPALEPYVQLADDVPANVTATAEEVTDGLDNDYDRAIALQDHLRTNFVYDEQAPVAQDYDGNGLAVLGEFFERRAGYCVHFASAMAVMARELDIPARIAVGYAPGRPASVRDDDGRTVFEVTSDDLHAWPELFFRGVGWVGFEPTPAVGTRTSFTDPQAEQPDSQEATEPNSAPGRADAVDRGESEAEQDVAQDESAPVAPRTAAATGALALLVVLAPGAVRAGRRRRRLSAARPTEWWREVQDTAADTGVSLVVSGTPRGQAETLRDRVDPASLDQVLSAVETARFARPGSAVADERSAARRLVADLESAAAPRTRWRARLVPRSLFRR